MAAVLHSTNIEYVKWDMNRQLSDLGSVELPADRQGELYHRYVLGVYELQERLLAEFPHLLLENCSGGGARFDPGMLYYSPQIWCSDDTDAIETEDSGRHDVAISVIHYREPMYRIAPTTPWEE